LDSRIEAREFAVASAATIIQIGTGLLIGWIFLRMVGWGERRELLLPVAFVNSANLPFPLLLANFGTEGLSLGVLCYTVTNLMIFSAGIMILHGGGRMREALREPALWATIAAGVLRIAHVQPPEMVMRSRDCSCGKQSCLPIRGVARLLHPVACRILLATRAAGGSLTLVRAPEGSAKVILALLCVEGDRKRRGAMLNRDQPFCRHASRHDSFLLLAADRVFDRMGTAARAESPARDGRLAQMHIQDASRS
jgi:hypothetical protein